MAGDLQVWIDARAEAAVWQVWGMHLVERQVRQLALLGIGRIRIWCLPQQADALARWRSDLDALYAVEREVEAASSGALADALSQLNDNVLLLGGDLIYDERVLAHLYTAGPGTIVYGEQGGGAFLRPAQAQALGAAGWPPGAPIWTWLVRHASALGLNLIKTEELAPYVASLRLTMAPFILQLEHPAQIAAAERLMYRRTFKGVIDAVARYGYYHLVRWITRHLSRTALTPNFFTVLSVIGIWAAVPCFASGQLWWGVLAAWLGVLLDSVDGKLARLRLHLSDAMGAFEHITAMLGLGLWYLALGWHFTEGEVFSTRGEARAMWWLFAFYWIDKALSGGFKACFKREIFDYAPVDAAFHLIASRRNISLLIFSLGLLLDMAAEAFLGMAAWMVLTAVFHVVRFVWVLGQRALAKGGDG